MKKYIRDKIQREFIEEEIAEDWCFVCKDGGSLRVCDYKKCQKAYHAECVEEEEGSFLHSKSTWTCGWHSCFNCNNPAKYHCFCCPNAVCQSCTNTVEFACVRGTKGFCHHCLKLALLGEADQTADSDGESEDFSNQETFECLFWEYWLIIKKEEKLTSEDLQTASTLIKNCNRRNIADSLLSESSKNDTKSDSRIKDVVEEVKSTHVKKRSECEPPVRKSKSESSKIDTKSDSRIKDVVKEVKSTHVKKRSECEPLVRKNKSDKTRMKFIEWGSEALIEFLTSIGKQTSKELSQYEVTSIVGRYISDNNLFNPGKKNKVLCNERLESLFQKKIFNKNHLLDLLRPHFAKNTEVTEHDDDEDQLVSNKKKKTSRKVKKAAEMKKVQEMPKSSFAAIIEENIKIVFLIKSLVKQLLDNHQPEAFDSKVIGCFVKIRSDPMDYLQKNSCQLVLITGVKRILQDDVVKVTLQASTGIINIDLEIEKLLDVMFDKEELDDLRKKVQDGLIPRPTVVDLELKAKSLHVELTNHAIDKELQSLEHRIDTANMRRRRAELLKHLKRRELLKSPEERKRMLETIPHVVAAPAELNMESPILNGQAGETLGSKESNPKKRASSSKKKLAEIKKVQEVPKSRFAAIVEDNIKIAFLMKSLVKQLLDNHPPEVFDFKVIGCFVKIRSDPMDYLQKNRCQLVLITGVKRTLQDDVVKLTLQASTGIIYIDIEIEKLLDVIFDEEELDDLRKRVEDGLIPRPTVVDLELKAKSLHEELTNHAIDKELRSLVYLIETANERGWKYELYKHLNRREFLKSPEERKRMVETLPRVVAAPAELNMEPPTLNGQAGETIVANEPEEVPAIISNSVVTGENNEPEELPAIIPNWVVVGENNEPEEVPVIIPNSVVVAGENQQSNEAIEEITEKEPPRQIIYIDSEDDED